MERLRSLYNIYLSFKDRERIPFIKIQEQIIPKKRGCYIIYDNEDRVAYVGRTKDLRARFNTHHRRNSGASSFRNKIKKKFDFDTEEQITEWIGEKYSVIFIEIENQKEERRFEHFLIALLNPYLND